MRGQGGLKFGLSSAKGSGDGGSGLCRSDRRNGAAFPCFNAGLDDVLGGGFTFFHPEYETTLDPSSALLSGRTPDGNNRIIRGAENL